MTKEDLYFNARLSASSVRPPQQWSPITKLILSKLTFLTSSFINLILFNWYDSATDLPASRDT